MFANMTRSSIALAATVALGLTLSACAHNNPDNLAAGAGYGASGPGSVQEFNQTVGDRVFFTPIRPTSRQPPRRRSTSRRRGSINTTNSASPSRVMPTSAERANTISLLAPAAPKRSMIILSPRACPLRG